MKNFLLAAFILTTSLSANAWVSDNKIATKQIKKNAITVYQEAANAKKESWAIKRASDIAEAKENYGGRYKGIKMDILELNRDELGSPSNDGQQAGFDITYTFLVYEQINASVHREIINESLSSAIVTCQVSAVQDSDRTVKIEDQKCTIKASKLITEATASF